jgi:predicted metal-dependent enzyme (double-stranded beta helix superfamily)
MTQTKAYTMEAFVDDARAVFASTKDPRTQAQQIARHMTTLLAEPGWLEEKLNLPAEGGFGRVDLHQDEEYGHPDGGFLLMCGIQRPGQDNLPHDHGTTWVVYGVYSGAIEQTKWRWSYPETDRTSPEIKPLESWTQGAGDIAFFLPGEIHNTKCVAEDRALVIRLEGRKLSGMLRHRYDPATNKAEVYASDN